MVSRGAGERDGSRQQKGSPRTKVGTKGRWPVGCVLSSSCAPLQGTGVEKGWRLARLGVGQGVTFCVYRAGGTSHCGQRAGPEVGVMLTDTWDSQDAHLRTR